MKRNYKYRLYPNRLQENKLADTLEVCRQVYNTALTQKRWNYKQGRRNTNYYQQAKELIEAYTDCPELKLVHSQVLQDVLRRLDKSFNNFFRRVKLGVTAGYPRYKFKDRYDSFTYPQSGFELTGNKLYLSKIGKVKVRKHRPIPEDAQIKTCTLKREVDRWYVVLCLELSEDHTPEKKPKEGLTASIGIDLGLTNLIATSEGILVKNPRHLKKSEDRLAEAQRVLARKHKGSARRYKQKQTVAKTHRKITNQRKDYLHKLAKALVDLHDFIAVEGLDIARMRQDPQYAKSIGDASWGYFIQLLTYKAEEAGKWLVKVDPRGTTQGCCKCHALVPKDIRERVHKCPDCGLVIDRDLNSAIYILTRGLKKIFGSGTDLRSELELALSSSSLWAGSPIR